MTQKKIAAFALCFLTAATSFAIGIKPRNLSHSMKGEDCGNRSNAGSAEALGELSCMLDPDSCLHKAAWYQERDNSMEPVSTEEGPGAAMAIFRTNNGTSQGVHVCPGWYLASAHGILNDPRKKNGVDPFWDITAYPLSLEHKRELPDMSAMVSPRLRDPSLWSDPATDYVFIKVENPVRPEAYVKPVKASDIRLVEASNTGDLDVKLYRPQQMYSRLSPDGTPDFDSAIVGGREMMQRYQSPMKVTDSCNLRQHQDFSAIASDCPTEPSVSGSPYIVNIHGKNFLIGIHRGGDPEDRPSSSFKDHLLPNTMLQSSRVCDDYEAVCGEPCAELDEVLPQSDGDISI